MQKLADKELKLNRTTERKNVEEIKYLECWEEVTGGVL